MLIQGGTISSGRLNTSVVVGEYWISSIRSLRMMTLPGVAAMLTPSMNFEESPLLDPQRAIAGLEVGGEIGDAAYEIVAARGERFVQEFGIGRDEIGWRQRARDLTQIELRLELRHRIGFGTGDEILAPERDDGMGLAEKIEERAFVPLRCGEAPIAGRDGNDGIGVLAGQPVQSLRPKGEESLR